MPGVNYAQRFFALLVLLREETDSEHGLDAVQISERLLDRTGLVVDPRSIRRTIADMIEAGVPINDSHKYCWQGVFSIGEVEYLANAVRYGYGLPDTQRQELAGKILALGDRRVHIEDEWPRRTSNQQMLQTLSVLRGAMDAGKQVAFHYGSYDIEGKLVPNPRRGSSGLPKIYNAHPYKIVCSNGRYYLIASVNRHTDLSHYRIDRIMDIRMRRSQMRPLQTAIRVEDYVLQHPYMYAGEVRRYRLSVERKHLNDVYDWFGRDIVCENSSDNYTDVLLYANKASLGFWLKRYGMYASIKTASEQ